MSSSVKLSCFWSRSFDLTVKYLSPVRDSNETIRRLLGACIVHGRFPCWDKGRKVETQCDATIRPVKRSRVILFTSHVANNAMRIGQGSPTTGGPVYHKYHKNTPRCAARPRILITFDFSRMCTSVRRCINDIVRTIQYNKVCKQIRGRARVCRYIYIYICIILDHRRTIHVPIR